LIIAGAFMSIPLLLAPAIVSSPMSALIIFGLSGFGYTSYTANILALTADVMPKHASASAWGLACIGNGVGGAIFQSFSGIILKTFSATLGYVVAYNYLFLGFGVSVIIGMVFLLFFAGPFQEDQKLKEYADS
jgi:ACS family hexuronate transporter-like MFS transporter